MPIEKRKNGSKKIDNSAESNETNNEHKSSRVRAEKTENNETNSSNGTSSRLVGWVVLIGIVLIIFIIFTFSKFNTLIGGNNTQDLERKVEKLEGEIVTLKNNQWITVWVHYGGGADSLNNVSWVGERSLGYPDSAKGKTCYVIGDKMRGEGGGSIGGRIGISGDGGRYRYSSTYEAELNNFDQKIEITKNGGYSSSDSNLTKTERNNLYLSFTMLCH